MACSIKMPEMNCVIIAGNLTKDPVLRKTSYGMPVANFCIATNRKFRDSRNMWQEEVCYVGVVAWSKLAESCAEKLHKGSAVLVDGELQSRILTNDDGTTRSIVEIKAHKIQFLSKPEYGENGVPELVLHKNIPECNPLPSEEQLASMYDGEEMQTIQ